MAENTNLTFEEALMQLEQIVRTLDAGQTSLDASLESYERGIKLLRHCHTTLQNAERRIEILKNVVADGTIEAEQVPESRFLTETTQPGQHRADDTDSNINDDAPSKRPGPSVRKKRVRKVSPSDETDDDWQGDLPFE